MFSRTPTLSGGSCVALPEMVPVPVEEFKNIEAIPMDVFIRLTGDKYVLIAKAGAQLDLSRLRSYQARFIDYLYMHAEAYIEYVQRHLNIVGAAIDRSDVTHDIKTKVLRDAAKSVLGEIERIGFSEIAFQHAQVITEATLTLIERNLSLSSLLNSLHQSSEHSYSHSVAVSAISVMIGGSMKWERPATREKLALGGLLHDVGMKELPPDLLKKSRIEMSYDERVIYESHAFRGMQVLQEVPEVPEDIVAIAYEHHENSFGQGYPRRLKEVRIHPLARVVAVADAFCEVVLESPQNKKARNAADAVAYIENVMGQPYSKEAFKALRSILPGLPPGKKKSG